LYSFFGTPVFFMKPDTALVTGNRPFYYPEFFRQLIEVNKYKVVIESEIAKHKSGDAIYFAIRKEKERVFYWKQVEEYVEKQV